LNHDAPTQPLRVLLPPLLALAACLLALRLGPDGDDGMAALWLRLLASASWVAGAWLAVRVLEVLFWQRLVPRRGGLRIPRLLRQLVAVLLVLLTVAVLLNQVWGLSLLPMLATTGAVGIIAGLALRNLLADFFSGIALNVEHPFRLDDFVLLHVRGKRDPVAGFVREINWRSTTVLTPEDNLISVPNSAVARATVENLSFPSPVYELELEVVLDWVLDTARLEPVLSAAMLEAWTLGATSGDKPPKFRIRRLDGAGVAYKIVYLIDPRKKPKGPARHTLLSCLHRHLRYAGLRPVMSEMAASGLPPRPQRFLDLGSAADRRLVIDQIGLLSVLTAGERARLAEGVRVCRVTTGTAVVQQGAAGHSMYLLAAGVLDVRVQAAGAAESQRSGVLSPGDFFGEMSLLTGSPRTATVTALCPALLFEVPFELMATLLDARPALAEGLSQVVAEHLRRDAAAQAPEAAAPLPEPSFTRALAARIRHFFASRSAL
jgi:small-conductance mechanosensitive channel/CRP-like cAMP-binding protein